MPELPEVETVRRGLAGSLEGAKITSAKLFRPDLRVPFPEGFVDAVTGRRVVRLGRRAKYLLFYLDDGQVIIAHLGMSGRMILRPQGHYDHAKHDHMLIQFDQGQELIFNDTRRFGMVLLTTEQDFDTHPLIAHLGPEPLSNAFSDVYLEEMLLKRKAPIKPTLMDQKVVVGVGNIYASESLFRCGIHPQLPAFEVAEKSADLVVAIREVLQAAIDSGGSTLRDYARESGEMGYFQHQFQVYGRVNQPCYQCQTPIERCVQTGRATFFCKQCQPEAR